MSVPAPSSPSGHSGSAPSPVPGLGHSASVLNAAHTPGPWEVIRDANHKGNRRVVSFHPVAVAKVYANEPVDDDEKAIANARLIAAAPELYEYLTIALGVISKAGIIWMGADKARAALSKVRAGEGECDG